MLFIRLSAGLLFDPVEKSLLLDHPLLKETGNSGSVEGGANFRLVSTRQCSYPRGAIVLQLEAIPGLHCSFDRFPELLVGNTCVPDAFNFHRGAECYWLLLSFFSVFRCGASTPAAFAIVFINRGNEPESPSAIRRKSDTCGRKNTSSGGSVTLTLLFICSSIQWRQSPEIQTLPHLITFPKVYGHHPPLCFEASINQYC